MNQDILMVSGIEVQVVRKSIKNLHLGVYPPDGRVRVAAPLHTTDDNVRLAVIDKLRWIRKHQAAFEEQPRQSPREMVTGESHYFLGQRYRLDVVERLGKPELVVDGRRLVLRIRPNTPQPNRLKLLGSFYRAELMARIPLLLAKWGPIVGEEVAFWGIKKMKTKWGSCQVEKRHLWFNLELAKSRPSCIEYVVVHELVHFLERHHNDAFRAHLDRLLPQWRLQRDLLNGSVLLNQ